jgi:hypothetical protein
VAGMKDAVLKGETVDVSHVEYGADQVCPACGKREPQWRGGKYYSRRGAWSGSTIAWDWTWPDGWLLVGTPCSRLPKLTKRVCSVACARVEVLKYAASLMVPAPTEAIS